MKINADLVKALLPIVIPFAKELASKTVTKVDDKIVAALESALANPMILALLLSLLEGNSPVLPAAATEEDHAAAKVLIENQSVVKGLFGA
jgi:hypothetical protein